MMAQKGPSRASTSGSRGHGVQIDSAALGEASRMHEHRLQAAADVVATFTRLALYWTRIVPHARTELEGWRRRALLIPDQQLRDHALANLDGENLNAEAAAVFALVAPRARRKTVTSLLVAFQTMYDYLDTVSEQPAPDPLAVGLCLHQALTAVFTAEPQPDYFRLLPVDDGGYLSALVAACRSDLSTLPSRGAVLDAAARAARRCGEAQSHTHAARFTNDRRLTRWALRQALDPSYHWWELGAGGISSLSVHALLAAAADPATTRSTTEGVDAAYYPSVCALSTLLDSLIDLDNDAAAGNFSYYTYYADTSVAIDRLVAITAGADAELRSLPHGRVHRAIMAGVAAFYLSAADTPHAQLIRQPVLQALGISVKPLVGSLGLRRRAQAARTRFKPVAAHDRRRPGAR
jgi:tetraprenyl-beta-curcumene synthase